MSDDQSKAVDQKEVINDHEVAPQTEVDKEQQASLVEFSKHQKNGKDVMRIKIQSPFHDYFDGDAFSMTGENATGIFDILPQHHNFISLLNPCELIVRTVDGEERKIRISGGLLHVKADRVIVFLDV